MQPSARVVGVALVALGLLGQPGAAQTGPRHCVGGRYLVNGDAIVTGGTAAPRQAITIQDVAVSIGAACAPIACKIVVSSKGTTVKASWKRCEGLPGRAVLQARFNADCSELSGTLVARKSRPKRRPFVATLSRCGDGVLDADGGEACDVGTACEGGARCDDDCRCVPVAATTTSTTLLAPTTSTTSSTEPSGGSTSTSTSTTSSTSTSTTTSTSLPPPTVARRWNQAALDAIRLDTPRPAVHARNLFHLAAAMWDAWAAYDQTNTAVAYVRQERVTSATPEADRAQAISFAAYGVLKSRYAMAAGGQTSLARFGALMDQLGYDKNFTSTDGATPAACGNRVATAVLTFGRNDGSNQPGDYDDPTYNPLNLPMIIELAGGAPANANRWQPLALDFFVTQNGIPQPIAIQKAITMHWGTVRPFVFQIASSMPPAPPQIGGVGDDAYRWAFADVIARAATLDPDDGAYLDISPATRGNNPLGTNDGTGYATNPATGRPYVPNVVPRGDFTRVLAEFWADGPQSETPAGHWNVVANYVSDRIAEKRFEATGPVLSDLEWDVKLYFALNAALHDAAVGSWGAKRNYDSVRPISAIRYMASLGQSSDSSQPSYNALGLPLVPGLIELISALTTNPGRRHEHLHGFEGELALYVWPGAPDDPGTQHSGAQWIRATRWVPYQRDSFVTPAFPGYTSAHSGFARAAAEILARFTGSRFFPGGLGEFVAEENAFLGLEQGPSRRTVLQWATYYDAADDAGTSTLYGGIQPYFSDFAGRNMGSRIGQEVFLAAKQYIAAPPK